MSNPRKRAAPGAVPMVPAQQQFQQPFPQTNMPNDQMVRWDGGNDGVNFGAGNPNSGNGMGFMQNGQAQYTDSLQPAPSNSLARRPMNSRALVQTNPGGYDPSQAWGSLPMDSGALTQPQHDDQGNEDSIDVLEEKAQQAKREAQAKRKQIPPFVQKLSSFLEEGKNDDLIRWSSKGDSFIVLDEDEFANTLIPELFKHRNYASFVRQLNMYGFHKLVGLSDNSMRASERKNKSPSEYANPYFRRGHPNLLWLINKPKPGKGKNKTAVKSEEPDSEEEIGHDELHGQVPGLSSAHAPKPLPAAPGDQPPPAKSKELSLVRDELRKVREQQSLIQQTLQHLQQNNRDLYNQALLFQNQHDRHQNSINAILHFLANLFRKSLEEQGSAPNVGDIISSMLANQGQQQSHGGNVVELGDLQEMFQNNNTNSPGFSGTPHRRARGLLPPIPDANDSARSTRSPSSAARGNYRHTGEVGQVTELTDGASETPPSLRQELENNPQEQMMRIINDHNATNSSGMDLPEAADFVANASNSMNNDQRSQLANFMSRQSPTGTGRSSATPPVNMNAQAPPQQRQPQQPNRRTAAPTPSDAASAPPPPQQANAGANSNGAPSLSPIMRSPAMPPLSINQISSNQSELEQLQHLNAQQEATLNNITDLLGPLSPSGRIPELDESANGTYFDPNSLDIDQYLNSEAFTEEPFGTGDDGLNLNFDGTDDPFSAQNLNQQPQQQRYNPNNLSAAPTPVNHQTPSDTGTEEIQREDFHAGDRTKRQRVA